MNIATQIIRSILAKWYLWTILPIITVIAVYTYLLSKPEQFISTATLYLNLPTEKSIALTDDIFEQNEFDRYIQNLMQISKSTRNVDRIRLLILKNYILGERMFIKRPIPDWLRQDSAFTINHIDKLIEEAKSIDLRTDTDARLNAFLVENGYSRENIKETIQAYRGQSVNYFIIQSQATDPFRAATFTKYTVNSLIYIEKTRDQSQLKSDQKILEEMVKEARKKLNEELNELERYKVENTVINLDEHTKAIVGEIVQLQKEKAKLLESIASSEKTIDEVSQILKDDGTIPINTQINDSLIVIQNKLDSLRQTRIENRFISMGSLDGQNVDQLIAESKKLRQRMSKQINNFIQDTPIDYRAARQQQLEKYLDAQVTLEVSKKLIPLVETEIDRMQQSASHFAPIESTISTLEDEIEIAQESYLLLLNKLNNLKSKTRDGNSNQLQIYEGPEIPQVPIGSGNKLLSAASAIAVFILIVLFIGLIEYLDQGVWDALSFKKKTGNKIAAFLPKINDRNDPDLKNSLKDIHDSQTSYWIKLLSSGDNAFSISGLIGGNDDQTAIECYKLLKERARKANLKVTYVNFTDETVSSENNIFDDIRPRDSLLIDNWVKKHKSDFTNYDIVFIILPSYKTDFTYQHVKNHLNSISVIYEAGFIISPLDKDFISKDRGLIKIFPILVDVPAEYLDVMTGPLNKSRNFLRSFTKDIIHGKLKR